MSLMTDVMQKAGSPYELLTCISVHFCSLSFLLTPSVNPKEKKDGEEGCLTSAQKTVENEAGSKVLTPL